jgi:preprotein translocase subunit SecY
MTSELGRRIWFTIGALLVYRLRTYIPLPGIDQAALTQLFHCTMLDLDAQLKNGAHIRLGGQRP